MVRPEKRHDPGLRHLALHVRLMAQIDRRDVQLRVRLRQTLDPHNLVRQMQLQRRRKGIQDMQHRGPGIRRGRDQTHVSVELEQAVHERLVLLEVLVC